MHGHHEACPNAFSRDRGFSLIELLIVLAILALLATVALVNYGESLQKGYQSSAMTQLRNFGDALEMYATANRGVYPTQLSDLSPRFMNSVPLEDPWGNPYEFNATGRGYTITAFGSDGVPGPQPPSPWNDEPYEVDIILADGNLIQAPGVGARAQNK